MLSNELNANHEVSILYPVFPDFTLLRCMRNPPSVAGYIKKCLIDLTALLKSPYWRYAHLLHEKVKVKAYWGPKISSRAFRGADVAVYFSAYQALELAQVQPQLQHMVYYVLHDQSMSDAHFVDPAIISATYHNRDRKIALSGRTAERLQMIGVRVEAIIPGGVADSLFHSVGRENSNHLSILAYYWPGEPRKGSSGLLDILRSVRKRYPDVKVSLLTPPGVRIRDFSTYSNLNEQALAELYRAHSIFVFPSAYEGFGLPPLEAMACGCAVIATKVGAVEEYARHGYSALLCDPGKLDQMEEALQAFLGSPELVARLAANAVKEAQGWTWRQAGMKMDAFLRSLDLRNGSTLPVV